jgi:hypothetical protein
MFKLTMSIWSDLLFIRISFCELPCASIILETLLLSYGNVCILKALHGLKSTSYLTLYAVFRSIDQRGEDFHRLGEVGEMA